MNKNDENKNEVKINFKNTNPDKQQNDKNNTEEVINFKPLNDTSSSFGHYKKAAEQEMMPEESSEEQENNSTSDDSNTGNDFISKFKNAYSGQTQKLKEEVKTLTQKNAELEEKINELEAKNKELDDKYLKKLAEFTNFRKRQQKLFETTAENFRDDIISRFLEVMDNFERALEACPTDDESQAAYIEGFRMIAQQMSDFLSSENVEAIEDILCKFDPTRHEAISQVQSDEHEPGTIVNVHQKGYCRGEKLIRPAKVAVAQKPSD